MLQKLVEKLLIMLMLYFKQELEIMMLSYASEKEEYSVEMLRNQTANSYKREVMETLLNFSLKT